MNTSLIGDVLGHLSLCLRIRPGLGAGVLHQDVKGEAEDGQKAVLVQDPEVEIDMLCLGQVPGLLLTIDSAIVIIIVARYLDFPSVCSVGCSSIIIN